MIWKIVPSINYGFAKFQLNLPYVGYNMVLQSLETAIMDQSVTFWKWVYFNRELTILGRECQPRLPESKTAISEIKAVKLCKNHNLKDLLSE